ncbi:alpha-1,6-mannosyl-glycoprotein 2-beta-N-acetylglucosaminyltransferase-like [Aphomia sociella]
MKLVSVFRLSRIPIYLVCLLVLYIAALKYFADQGSLYYVPKHLRKYLRFNEKYTARTIQLTDIELENLNSKLERLNSETEILNWGRYGPVTEETTILLVQVHHDPERLQYRIISLAQVHYIQDVLLIFSHSYYDEEVNNLIRSIRFCKVMQIFYPYSLQLHPNAFSGVDPNNCINMTQKGKSKIAMCVERDAQLTERKQHWWWKANFVFGSFEWSATYKGTVVFLEADNYVLPDFLYMLKYAKRALSYFPDVEVLSFGKMIAKDIDYDLLTIDAWRPLYDKGMAFNKTTWLKIVTLSSYYCTYDDSSWSNSLLHLFEKSKKGYVDMVGYMAPRVLSTGVYDNGHHAFNSIWLSMKSTNFYPETVKTVLLFSPDGHVRPQRKVLSHGSDVRDQMLCLDPLITTIFEPDVESKSSSFETGNSSAV